jgi:hypothetical protein
MSVPTESEPASAARGLGFRTKLLAGVCGRHRPRRPRRLEVFRGDAKRVDDVTFVVVKIK